MSIFGKIKDAIFGNKAAPSQAPGGTTQTPTGTTTQASPSPQPQPQAQQVDVGQVLSQIASEKGNPDLNYKTSIVDLLKLLDLDSSLEARKELAKELGVNAGAHGSAEQNIALHKAVMREVAKNGGKVPDSLKD
ncbi:MAG: DUF3597 domain-containing protein [Sphingomicrobium sp.]